MLLDGQVAAITGSSRGIGQAIALHMAREHAAVVINGRDETRVRSVVDTIHALGGAAVGVCESIETIQGGQRLIDTALEHFGKIDILVNNAGIAIDKMSYKLTEEDWDSVINVHLRGTFTCTKPAIIYMRERNQGGSIINMTSLAGLQGTIGQLNYSAAKAGIVGMTRTLALELRRDNISVNAIAPAALTDMTRPYVEKARRAAAERGQPMPEYWKIGHPEDVANLVVALVSPTSRGISGKVFSVNGSRIGVWEQPQHHVLADRPDAAWSPEEILTQILNAAKDEDQSEKPAD